MNSIPDYDRKCVNRSYDTKLSLLPLVCNIEIHRAMKIQNKSLALVLFVLSTTLILGTTTDAFAVDPDGRGSTGAGAIEACLNVAVPPTNYSPCDTSSEWSGGNIQLAPYKQGNDTRLLVSEGPSEAHSSEQELPMRERD